MRGQRRVAALLAVVAATLAGCTGGGSDEGAGGSSAGAAGSTGEAAGELVVLAAASLSEVVEELAAAVEAAHPSVEVTLSFGGSADLVAQVLAGAPADVLMTADETTMARAEHDGAVAAPVVVAENSPVLVVPAGNPAGVTGLDDLDGAALVVCAPQVPCGAAAAELARRDGVTLAPVSEESAVTDVLGKVTSGQADAGVVYATDARRAGGAVEVVDVPGSTDVLNRYPAAAVTGGDPELAALWLDAVTGAPGRTVLADAGFTLP
ncbi:molybdate ABC transporter substrate-binding protein [Georgenia sp. M64]|uniref:molybdate ABC transporter substrate-binding protein n=1 Tax=Georgenia sp. M64 TaxID=3120520 RepID=UPI0030E5B48E